MYDDRLISSLEAVLADPNARPSTKVQAVKQLAALREHASADSSSSKTLERMKDLVEEFCPGARAMWDEGADPMRDLDLHSVSRGKVASLDPLAWSWLPFCPADPKRAELGVLAAVRRLGLGPGPYAPPGEAADELAARRRRRSS